MLTERGADGPAIEQRYRRGGAPTPSPREQETPPPRSRTQYIPIDTPPPSPRQSQSHVDKPVPETPVSSTNSIVEKMQRMSEQQSEMMREFQRMQAKLAEKEKQEAEARSLNSVSARDRYTPDLTEVILKQTEVMDKMN